MPRGGKREGAGRPRNPAQPLAEGFPPIGETYEEISVFLEAVARGGFEPSMVTALNALASSKQRNIRHLFEQTKLRRYEKARDDMVKARDEMRGLVAEARRLNVRVDSTH